MGFEDFGRARSAEFIAAQRARSRSLSRSGTAATVDGPAETATGAGDVVNSEPQSYNTDEPVQLFISPSPIYGIPQRHEFQGNRSRSPPTSPTSASGGSLPRRTISKISGRNVAAASAIPEVEAEGEVGLKGPALPATGPTRRSSQSSAVTLDGGAEAIRAGAPNSGAESNTGQAEPKPNNQEKKETDLEKSVKKGEAGEKPTRKLTAQPGFDENFLVTLEGRDHLNPHTWNENYRWYLTGLTALLVLNSTFASSGPSQLLPSIIRHFGVSIEVGILTIALFVAGYCVGPLFWGPLSERYGRKLVFIVAFVPYTGFQVGCALSPNIGSLLVFRFISGCFAASPLTNSGGVIADLWDADRRGIALALFALAPFAGPAIAPVIAGALEVTGSNWRWMFWILTIFAGICLAIIVFLLPETYVPYLLHLEAKKLRKTTGDKRWYTANDHPDHKVTIRETLDHTVLKPFIMIFEEPMLMVLTIYLSFVYGIVYLLFEAVPLIFQDYHKWNALQGGLAFMGLPIGGALGVFTYIFTYNRSYMKKHHALKGHMVQPEERLKPLMVAAPGFALAFFWIGWTYYPSINPVSPLLAICLMGFTILFMFLSIFNYLIDTYLHAAASALAINTVFRSAFGAGFPLFASQMYAKLGVPGASSLLGGLALLFLPAPFVLFKYGRKIREMSKNATVLD